MKILVFGSKGMVGSSINRVLSKNSEFELDPSSRNDTDLFSYEETLKRIELSQPDIIVNAAAKVGGIYANNTQRVSFILDNLKINMNILEASTKFENLKIINLGSSCIYPLDSINPITEDNFMGGKLEPTNSPYAMAKLSAIEIGKSINLEFGHQVTNLMPTNLYGQNDFFSELDSHVIPGLIMRMHLAKINNVNEFLIWGSGKPLREFLHVDDLSKAIERIITSNTKESLINVGSSEEISIKNLAELIQDVVGYEGRLGFDNSKPDGNPRKLLDSSKILQLGWKPEIELSDGLQSTYTWFVENIKL